VFTFRSSQVAAADMVLCPGAAGALGVLLALAAPLMTTVVSSSVRQPRSRPTWGGWDLPRRCALAAMLRITDMLCSGEA